MSSIVQVSYQFKTESREWYDGSERFRWRAEKMQATIFLQAALNGDRIHPAAPRNPTAIAEAARAVVDAGAQSVHVHAIDDAGRETLDGAPSAKVLRAIRALCPESPISLTTSAAIVGDPSERF